MATPNYQYEPLGSQRSIRIFSLLPARDRKDPVEGTLSEVNLDSSPSYEALSYVWGRPEPRMIATVLTPCTGGGQKALSISVTLNCLSALQTLRLRFKPRKLWIDAICINQNSTPEKSQQVPLMAEIYGKASQVLVWLDAGNENREQVKQTSQLIRQIGWLHRMRLLRLYASDEHTGSRMPKNTKLVAACEKYVNSKSHKLGDSFNAPFVNLYFQRVWTVQEIAMAHRIRVHYGTSVILWRDFVASALFTVIQPGGFLRNHKGEIDAFLDGETQWKLLNSLESHFVLPDIYGLEALYDNRNKRNILGKLTLGTAELALVKSKGLDATEPKDKAYAMLWAFPDSSMVTDPLRQVDYNKTIDDIYTEYATAIFTRMKGASEQFYWVNSAQRNTSLPSWVPDWRENTSMWFNLWAATLKSFQAAREDSNKYKLEFEGRLLRIWGIEHSRIKALIKLTEEVRQRDFNGAEPEGLLEALIDTAELLRSFIGVSREIIGTRDEGLLEAFHRVIHPHKGSYVPGPEDQANFIGTQKEVGLSQRLNISIGLLRILVFDKLSPLMDGTTVPTKSLKSTLAEFLSEDEAHDVIQKAKELPNLPPFFATVVSLQQYIDIFRFVHIALLNHRDKDFFLTDKGNMGIAFHGLNAGDTIAVWKGCPSPMVVRKAERDGRSFYRFHGPAYVDGIMNGEAWVEEEDHLHAFELI